MSRKNVIAFTIENSTSFLLGNFLRMLSVERTKDFISELSLPVERDNYPAARDYARACLELYVYPSVLKDLPDSPDFHGCWKAYRENGGVLTDSELALSTERYRDLNWREAFFRG